MSKWAIGVHVIHETQTVEKVLGTYSSSTSTTFPFFPIQMYSEFYEIRVVAVLVQALSNAHSKQ